MTDKACRSEIRRIATASDGDVAEIRISSDLLSVVLCSYGATVLSLKYRPCQSCEWEEMTLNYRSFEEYHMNMGPYFGCIVGRVANRCRLRAHANEIISNVVLLLLTCIG